MELLYLDQNYLSGIVKRKLAFRELEPVLRAAVARGAVAVPESEAHQLESAARPDLPLLALLRELSGGLTLPNKRGAVERHCEWRLEAILNARGVQKLGPMQNPFDLQEDRINAPHEQPLSVHAPNPHFETPQAPSGRAALNRRRSARS